MVRRQALELRFDERLQHTGTNKPHQRTVHTAAAHRLWWTFLPFRACRVQFVCNEFWVLFSPDSSSFIAHPQLQLLVSLL